MPFGFHAPELIILLVIAVIIFGPKRLPELGGALGKGIKEFKRGTSEIEDKVTGHASSVEVPAAQPNDVVVPEHPVESGTVREREAG